MPTMGMAASMTGAATIGDLEKLMPSRNASKCIYCIGNYAASPTAAATRASSCACPMKLSKCQHLGHVRAGCLSSPGAPSGQPPIPARVHLAELVWSDGGWQQAPLVPGVGGQRLGAQAALQAPLAMIRERTIYARSYNKLVLSNLISQNQVPQKHIIYDIRFDDKTQHQKTLQTEKKNSKRQKHVKFDFFEAHTEAEQNQN